MPVLPTWFLPLLCFWRLDPAPTRSPIVGGGHGGRCRYIEREDEFDIVDETAIEARAAVAEKDEDVDILEVEHMTFASSDEEPLEDELIYLPTEPLLDHASEDEVDGETDTKRKGTAAAAAADGEVRALHIHACGGGWVPERIRITVAESLMRPPVCTLSSGGSWSGKQTQQEIQGPSMNSRQCGVVVGVVGVLLGVHQCARSFFHEHWTQSSTALPAHVAQLARRG